MLINAGIKPCKYSFNVSNFIRNICAEFILFDSFFSFMLFIFAVMGITSGTLTFKLPETKDRKMPEILDLFCVEGLQSVLSSQSRVAGALKVINL